MYNLQGNVLQTLFWDEVILVKLFSFTEGMTLPTSDGALYGTGPDWGKRPAKGAELSRRATRNGVSTKWKHSQQEREA